MSKVDELRAQLAQAEKEQEEAARASRQAQSEAWKVLVSNPDNWEWRATPTEHRPFFKDEDIKDGAVVEKRLKQDLLEAWRANGAAGVLFAAGDYAEPGRWFGMFYYRTDENILTHDGGGHLVLADPKLCNDAEWADILAGRPPAKFLKKIDW